MPHHDPPPRQDGPSAPGDFASVRAFSGAVPQLYDRYLVPMIFEAYATDLTRRVAAMPVRRVLEVAAGTGVVTRAMAATLRQSVQIVATDINQPMLDRACAIGTVRPVEFRQADAVQLPFADDAFDVVVCQFGAMFFPDKARAFAEARRVLRPGGVLLFNVWDRIEENEFADTVTEALAGLFPGDPPDFMRRLPHGYFERDRIEGDLAAAGFARSRFETIAERSRAESAHVASLAYCQGTPLRMEIDARDPARLAEATDAGAAALERRFGTGPIEGKIQAHVVTVFT